jgi:hypothetical protein
MSIKKVFSEMTQPQQDFNRTNFILLNNRQLFTAKQVADLIQHYTCPKGATMTPQPQQEQVVYSKTISVPSKAFPSIKKRCLALNDIGDNDDGFTRIPFELKDGDVIQVLRSK